jgi:hypothetical protein
MLSAKNTALVALSIITCCLTMIDTVMQQLFGLDNPTPPVHKLSASILALFTFLFRITG